MKRENMLEQLSHGEHAMMLVSSYFTDVEH